MRVFVDERLSIAVTDTRGDGVAGIVARAVEEELGNKLVEGKCEAFADGVIKDDNDGIAVGLNEAIALGVSRELNDGAGNEVTNADIDSKGDTEALPLIDGTGEELVNIVADERPD